MAQAEFLSDAARLVGVLTNGAVLTQGDAGNTHAPDPWPEVLAFTGGTMTFDNTNGTFVHYNNSGSMAQTRKPVTATDVITVVVEIGPIAIPGAEMRLIEVRNNNDTGYACRLNVTTAGKLRLYNAANALLWTSTNSIAGISGGARVALTVWRGTTTANGQFRVHLYTGEDGRSATAIESTPGTGNIIVSDAGITSIVKFYVGFSSGSAVWTLPTRNTQMNRDANVIPRIYRRRVNNPRGLGLANGATATTGNTGGVAGDAFSAVNPTAGGTVTYADANGGAWRCTAPTASATAPVEWRPAFFGWQGRVSFELDGTAAPTTAAARIAELLDTAGAVIGYLTRGTDNRLRLYDKGNTLRWTSPDDATGYVPTGAACRIALGIVVGTTTSNGRLTAALYTASGGKTTTAASSSTDTATFNTGTVRWAGARFGVCTTGTVATVDVHDIHGDDDVYSPMLDTLSAGAPTLVRNATLTRTEDYSGSSAGPGSTLTATILSGPVPTINIVGLVATWEDDVTRAQPLTIRWTVNDSGNSSSEVVTYTGLVGYGSHRVVVRNGAWV